MLLARRGEGAEPSSDLKSARMPLIEVINDAKNDESEKYPEIQGSHAVIIGSCLSTLSVCLADEATINVETQPYGFNGQYSGNLAVCLDTENEINEIPDPQHTNNSQRHQIIQANETAKFDEDYYISDFWLTDSEIAGIIAMPTFWSELCASQENGAGSKVKFIIEPTSSPADESSTTNAVGENKFGLDEAHATALASLPKKEYLISDPIPIYLGLVDILFGYCYDYRFTDGEFTVESPWTIGKLSATLSGLASFHSLDQTLISCISRSLVYPFYRSWSLANVIIQDVAMLLKLGQPAILRALLDTKARFDVHSVYGVYSQLYLEDYCIWIQQAR